jgi:hypothetical protein
VCCLACRESALEIELGVDTLNTVDSVEILHQSDLITSGRTLARDDGGAGEEEFPDLIRVLACYVMDG